MNPYQKRLSDLGWIDAEGNIIYPSDDAALQKMLRDLLGSRLISIFDESVTRAQDCILKSESKEARPEGIEEEVEDYRQVLKSLSREEKVAACHLIYRTAEQILFSTLVALDQFKGGELTMQVDPSKHDGPNKIVNLNPYTDLHEDFHYWLGEFSQIDGNDEEG